MRVYTENDLPAGLRGQTWTTQDGVLTTNDIVHVLRAVAEGRQRFSAVADAWGNSDRRVNRATRSCARPD